MDTVEKLPLLIVDDDILNINFIVETLKDTYSLYIAKDGEVAIDLALRHRPVVILLDIVMPGIDGYQTLSYLGSLEEMKDTAIVFMSTLKNELHQELALNLNPAAYLKKPLDAERLLSCVKEQIEQRGAR